MTTDVTRVNETRLGRASITTRLLASKVRRIVEKYISTQDKIKTKLLYAKNANKPCAH